MVCNLIYNRCFKWNSARGEKEQELKKKGSENRLFIADQVRELQEYIASVLLSMRIIVWLRNLHGNGVGWS